jgi:hypothetical protein
MMELNYTAPRIALVCAEFLADNANRRPLTVI